MTTMNWIKSAGIDYTSHFSFLQKESCVSPNSFILLGELGNSLGEDSSIKRPSWFNFDSAFETSWLVS